MNDIEMALREAFPDAVIQVEGSGSKLMIAVSSPVFKGVSRVMRQRQVKSVLKPWIDSGELHAVSLAVSDGE